MGVVGVGEALLEREAELDRLRAAIDQAVDGGGSVLLVEGPPGIGKTELLRAGRELAQEAGATALTARGSELEGDFAFGVVRQLFQAPVAAMAEDERGQALSGAAALAGSLLGVEGAEAPSAGGEIFPLLHGLHWLTANLALTQPLVLLVDDAHWADKPSLRFLHYLSGRIEELPVLAVAATRSTRPEAPVASLEAMRDEPVVSSIAPSALSERAAGHVLAEAFGREPDDPFTEVSWEASGGNPFLVTELARSLVAEGVEPTAAAATQVGEIGPERVSRSVFPRLARLGPEAQELARWTAVLGDGAELRTSAALAGIEPDAALGVADALAEGHVLAPGRPLTFAHPLIRSAVYGDLAPGERSRRHALAAKRLREEAAPAEQVASHVLLTDVGVDPAAVATLSAAAEDAIERGAPSAAVTLLERAVAECHQTGQRHELLKALAGAALLDGDPRATTWGDEAIETAPDAAAKVRTIVDVIWIGLALRSEEDFAAQLFGLADQLQRDDPELAALAEVHGMAIATMSGDDAAMLSRIEAWDIDRPPSSEVDRMRLAACAAYGIAAGLDAESVLDLARRADPRSLYGGATKSEWPFYYSLHQLAHAGAAREALEAANFAVEDARRRGSRSWLQNALAHRSYMQLILGNVEGATSDALMALELEIEGLAYGPRGLMYGWAIRALVERGELADAAEVSMDEKVEWLAHAENIYSVWFLGARAELALAQGDPAASVEDCRRITEVLSGSRFKERSVGVFPWRCTMALGLNALGDSERASEHAEEEVEVARRFGAARVLGAALRVRGVVRGGTTGLDDLREAVEVLKGDEARLEYAKSLVELGAALRRANQRKEAREPLREGLDLARRCGAIAVAERAREELAATGARPRKEMLSGVESLTASELRTARLAAEGLTNREIAQQLYVTQKTVETHLRHCYQKLEIEGRGELADRLTA